MDSHKSQFEKHRFKASTEEQCVYLRVMVLTLHVTCIPVCLVLLAVTLQNLIKALEDFFEKMSPFGVLSRTVAVVPLRAARCENTQAI